MFMSFHTLSFLTALLLQAISPVSAADCTGDIGVHPDLGEALPSIPNVSLLTKMNPRLHPILSKCHVRWVLLWKQSLPTHHSDQLLVRHISISKFHKRRFRFLVSALLFPPQNSLWWHQLGCIRQYHRPVLQQSQRQLSKYRRGNLWEMGIQRPDISFRLQVQGPKWWGRCATIGKWGLGWGWTGGGFRRFRSISFRPWYILHRHGSGRRTSLCGYPWWMFRGCSIR